VYAGIDHGLHEQEDISRTGAAERRGLVHVVFILGEYLFAQSAEDDGGLMFLFIRDLGRGGPHGDPFADLPRRVRHGPHHGTVRQSGGDGGNVHTSGNAQNQRVGMNAAMQFGQHAGHFLRLYREHDDVPAFGRFGVVRGPGDAEFFRQAAAAFRPRAGCNDLARRQTLLFEQADDHRLRHHS